jgi:hypothetical protein
VNSAASGLVPVHIGQPMPGSEEERDLLETNQRRLEAGAARIRRLHVSSGLDWEKHGLQPRWLGMETSDCAVALEPGFFHGQGATERGRFLAGAKSRGELALVVAVIGDVDDDSPRSVLSSSDWSVRLSTWLTISGRRLLAGGNRPALAPGLGPADRDLAMRLLNRHADAPWWGLRLNSPQGERGDGSGTVVYAPPAGDLHPILVDGLGDPVVAAWTPAAGGERWYIVPADTDWNTILSWLVGHALPEYVPGALRRARSPHFVDPDLQTSDEASVRQKLADLEAEYAAEKLRLEDELREAEARAEPVRYGLLYGTGKDLVNVVATVLEAAGLKAVDLDEELGGPLSADLLVSVGGEPPRRLVEVKAAGGVPHENLIADLQRHLATWPQLRPQQPVTGGAMFVNHQHKLPPSQRTEKVYNRTEFVAALPFPVMSTVELFNWWRGADWGAIRTAIFGMDPLANAGTVAPPSTPANPAKPASNRWRSRARGRLERKT